ncbi:MAG: hypothetical protein II978_00815 [Clostridia bacterium]|nr:hypothetical protein [Clostridia bacterium]
MFDKKTENNLKKAIGSIDADKIKNLKEKLNQGSDLNSILSSLDVKKAQQKLSELNIGNVDLNAVLGELKNNPDLLKELKKKL